MTTIERCQLRNCVYFVVINDGNNFFAETQFLAKSTEVFKSHSKTVDKIDLCGNFWFCFGKIELFCRIPFELYKVKKYDAISSVCVCIKSCVFERKPSSILNAWIHPHINVDDESKSQQLNRERREERRLCVKLMKWILGMPHRTEICIMLHIYEPLVASTSELRISKMCA